MYPIRRDRFTGSRQRLAPDTAFLLAVALVACHEPAGPGEATLAEPRPAEPVAPAVPGAPQALVSISSTGAHTIQIDATALTAPVLDFLPGLGQFSTTDVVTVNVDPGDYTLQYAAGTSTSTQGALGDRGSVLFTVLADGTVDFSPTLDAIMQGRGTSSLVVNGASLQIDVSPLTASVVTSYINGQIVFDESGPTNVVLLPGAHFFSYLAGTRAKRGLFGDAGAVEFLVGEDGTITYAAALEGMLTGTGTTSLNASGAAITLDVSALSASGIGTLAGGSVPLAGASVLRLLPGEHVISYPTARNTFQGLLGDVGIVAFTVGKDATVAYDPALEGILSGAGTPALTANGTEIQADVSALTAVDIQIRRGGLSVIPDVTTLRLLPGEHWVGYGTVINLLGFPSTVGDVGIAEFDVLTDGTLDYDASLDAIFSGRGTANFDVPGVTVGVDLSHLSAAPLVTRLGLDIEFGDSGIPRVDGVAQLTLLPGPHEIYYTSASGGIGGAPFVDFSVDAAGLFDFDPSFDVVMQGRGSSNLVVSGSPIQIDATCVDPVVYPTFSVIALGTFPTTDVHTVTLLPGDHRLDLSPIITVFGMGRDGLIDKAVELDLWEPKTLILEGVGTDELVINTNTPHCIDAEPPVTSGVAADPNPVSVSTGVTLIALIDDAATGGSVILSAEYSLDGGAFSAMQAADGSFDEVTEDVTAAIGPFGAAAVHDVCVRGSDAAGNVSAEACILLAVYDPDAGFVTGAGWIDSPPGAYAPDPSLTGKATFGFVSRYQKGAMVPDGQTQFRFKVADLDFSSSSYEWLVIAGARAQYKGSGTVNGMGDYGFMLTAIDGEISGGGGMDKFRMKIWDKATGVVIYDNQLGASDTTDPTTSIGGGSIVIHK